MKRHKNNANANGDAKTKKSEVPSIPLSNYTSLRLTFGRQVSTFVTLAIRMINYSRCQHKNFGKKSAVFSTPKLNEDAQTVGSVHVRFAFKNLLSSSEVLQKFELAPFPGQSAKALNGDANRLDVRQLPAGQVGAVQHVDEAAQPAVHLDHGASLL